jgi:predicted nucleotidyltransferase
VDVAHPIRSVIPTLHGAVLEVLARAHTPMTGRQVARVAEPPASQKGVANALTDLVAAGVVLREDVPPAAMFRLNRQHLAAGAVIELASLRSRLIERLRELFAGWRIAPSAAALFGSAARGDGGPDSDIDVLLVRPDLLDEDDPDWHDQRYELARAVEAWTGNRVQVVEIAAAELRKAVDAEAALVEHLRREAIELTDSSLPSLLTKPRTP